MASEKMASGTKRKSGIPLLSDLCLNSIVKDLERYPAAAFGIIDEFQWDSIIKLRHKKTKPLKGKGGIDGSGRLHPAVTDKFMLEVEEGNPHLNESKIADLYAWRDIVEYKFKKGGLSRPKGLLYPWPVLLQQMEDSGKALADCLNILGRENNASGVENEKVMASTLHAIKIISESPMDLNLLKTTGIGKKVKKFLSKSTKLDFLDEPYIYSSGKDIRKTPRTELNQTLQSWMDLAAESGVKMKAGEARAGGNSTTSTTAYILTAAKKCDSWRSLYHTLKIHDEDRRSRHGERMRERRRRLDTVRPKIVKVHRASARQEKMLSKSKFGGGYNPSQQASKPGSAKMQELRMEALVTSTRRAPPTAIAKAAARKQASDFGAAVAFASVGKKVTGRRKTAPVTKTVTLAGGKRMAVPDAKSLNSANVQKRLKMLKRGHASFRS
mmetsp:Transcript_4105/g.9899  ORF Transcript_4105/g.9899 Transcript_4105/m.9899 type:complete len:440 (-) Transcript_4105:1648-2967(-)